jgi:hypothetical protein
VNSASPNLEKIYYQDSKWREFGTLPGTFGQV